MSAPRWMSAVLWSAAVYNIAWGALVVAFPLAPFRWAGLPAPIYPEFVQVAGMLVGVYGVTYALAARDPLRLWPIVLAGLLGKVLGPIGFVWSAAHGRLPWVVGWTLLTNDLIWWVPFAVIVRRGWRAERAGRHPTPEREP